MMNNTIRALFLLITLAVAALSALWLWHTWLAPQRLNCVGNVVWEIANRRFAGTLAWRMEDHQGVVTINGKLKGDTVSRISRNIYFSYEQQNRAHILLNKRVVKTFADTASPDDLRGTLPAFYDRPGRQLSLLIDDSTEAWLFATSNVPSLYCHKR